MKQNYIRNVVTLDLSPSKCVGCGRCVEVCPHHVFRIQAANGKKAELVDRDACMECGACARNCPAEAIAVRAGVGCAWAITKGKLTGTEPTCGCSGSPSGSSCCG